MISSKHLIRDEDIELEDIGGGLTRKILGYNHQLMLVKVWFEEGAIGYIHEHYHAQSTYVESGEFEVTVGDEVQTLKAGDSFFIPPNTKHGAVCKKAGTLIDTFSPVREDFLKDF